MFWIFTNNVKTPERTIQGTYFRSDEGMNHYFISNSKGSFIAEDMEDDKQSAPDTATVDTVPAYKRPVLQKHATGKN